MVFDSKLNWKENINSALEKNELENVLHEKAEIIWSKFIYAVWEYFKEGRWVSNQLDSFKTLHEKRLYRKLMQILNDPTHPMRHYFDSRRSNRGGRFLLPRTNTNRYKASFLPSALSVFNEKHTSH